MNLRPSGYEPDELPGCSTPRHFFPGCFSSSKNLSSAYITEAKRPLEGGLLFGWAGVVLRRCCFIDHAAYRAPFGGQCMIWYFLAINRPGSDLLSRVLRRSTIGAGAFHGRVRNGNGCSHPALTTRSTKGKIYTCRAGVNLALSLHG